MIHQKENIRNKSSGEVVHKKFFIENKSLYYYYFDEGEMSKDWMCTAFHILKVRYNEETSDFCYELIIQSDFGDLSCCVSKGLFTYKNFDVLAQKGLNFSNKFIPQIIEYARCEEQEAEHIREYTFLGWKNNKFSALSEKNREYIGDLKLSQSDDYDYKGLNKLLKNAYGLQLALTVSCSSCLLGYLGQNRSFDSPIIHFYGDTSLGKTTALKIGASVWGKPDIDSGLLSTWNQTENCLMNRLCNNFAVSVSLDEASICHYDMTSFIYNFSQGVNRQRLMKNGKQAATKQWLTTMLSSGEASILEQSNRNSGLCVRVFEFSKPITKSAKHSNQVKQFVNKYYGHIGKDFAEVLECNDYDDIAVNYDASKIDFIKAVPKEELMPTTDRLSDYYALWITTAEILSKTLDIEVEPDKIKELLLEHHKSLNTTLNVGKTLYNIIIDRIISKGNSYPKEKQYFGESVEGIICPNGEALITRSAFEQILKENGFTNRLTALRALEGINCLKKQREDTYYSMRTLNNVKTKVIVIDISNDYLRPKNTPILTKRS